MASELFPAFAVAFLISVSLLFLLVRRSFRKRRVNRIIERAQRLGLTPTVDPDAAFDRFFQQGFLLLSKVRNPIGGHVKYLLEKRMGGCRIYLFDFEVVHLHDSNTLQSVIVLESDRVVFPDFALIPRKLKRERFTQRLRTAPLEFTSRLVSRYRKIDARIDGYDLSCPVQSGQTVLELMNAEIRAYFSGQRKYAVEGRGKALLMYQRERLASPEHLETFIEEGMMVYQLFQASVSGAGPKPGTQSRSETVLPSA